MHANKYHTVEQAHLSGIPWVRFTLVEIYSGLHKTAP